MDAGKLDREISLNRKVITQDPVYGTELISWVVAARVWAEVQDALPSKAESVVQGLAVARNQVRIRFRFRADVDSSMTVTVHGPPDETLQIVGGPAAIGGRREFTEVVCERYST
ncbi:MAG: phage head closure protein [Betaproteobacteria bacterium]